jgi:hypothetical protein
MFIKFLNKNVNLPKKWRAIKTTYLLSATEMAIWQAILT